MEKIFGIAFDIEYDPKIIGYHGYFETGLLSRDGQKISFLKSDNSDLPGEKNFGISRQDSKVGTIDGPGLVVTLVFKSLQRGETWISFSENHICILEEDGSHYYKNVEQRSALIRVK